MSVLLGEYSATSHLELTHLNSLAGQKRHSYSTHAQTAYMHGALHENTQHRVTFELLSLLFINTSERA